MTLRRQNPPEEWENYGGGKVIVFNHGLSLCGSHFLSESAGGARKREGEKSLTPTAFFLSFRFRAPPALSERKRLLRRLPRSEILERATISWKSEPIYKKRRRRDLKNIVTLVNAVYWIAWPISVSHNFCTVSSWFALHHFYVCFMIENRFCCFIFISIIKTWMPQGIKLNRLKIYAHFDVTRPSIISCRPTVEPRYNDVPSIMSILENRCKFSLPSKLKVFFMLLLMISKKNRGVFFWENYYNKQTEITKGRYYIINGPIRSSQLTIRAWSFAHKTLSHWSARFIHHRREELNEAIWCSNGSDGKTSREFDLKTGRVTALTHGRVGPSSKG